MAGSYERIRSILDKRPKGTPMSLEEANMILDKSSVHIGLDPRDNKYFWFAIMNDNGGYNTPRGALNAAVEYLKNGGY